MSIGNRIKQFREENNMTQKEIAEILEVEPGTISKYESNLIEPNIKSLIRLSDTFQITIDELIKEDDEEYEFDVSEIDILATLKEQKEMKLEGNLYHNTQIIFAYNSCHIEGNKLSETQTRNIYNTQSISFDGTSLLNVNDIVKINNHFKLFDYMLDSINKKFSESMIISFHDILEEGTLEKNNENVLTKDLEKVVTWYNSLSKISFEKIIELYVRLEKLKAFSSDNGIIGRMIIYRECLKNDILPLIILDKDKLLFFRGLNEYIDKKDKDYLIEICLNAQDQYSKTIEKYLK